MKRNFLQQGDVLIKSIADFPEGLIRVKSQGGRLILAEGEATGHVHAIAEAPSIELFEKDDILYLKNSIKALVEHEEHGEVVVPPGLWEIDKVKEYDHFDEESRRVSD